MNSLTRSPVAATAPVPAGSDPIGHLVPILDVYLGASLAGRSGALADQAIEPMAQEVARRLNELEPFWRDGYPDHLEVVALADRLGALFDHPSCLFGQTPAALRTASAPLGPDMFSCELAQFRAGLDERLTLLREDPVVLQGYLAFLREVWNAFEPARAADRDARVIPDGQVEDLPHEHVARALPHVRRHLASRYSPERIAVVQALIVPSSGFFILLENRAFVGSPFDDEAWRGVPHAASTEIARRHAVLSDPTRVMLLAYLGRRERSVTQIAADLHMTQPNATRHVKILLDAGLIESRRAGRLTYYHFPESAMRQFFADAARELATLTIW